MAKLCRYLLLAVLSLFWAAGAEAATYFLKARLDGAQAGIATSADGAGFFTYDTVTRSLTWTVTYRNLSSPLFAAHIHGPAAAGVDAAIVVPFANSASPFTGAATITAAQEAEMLAGLWYVNVHSTNFTNGEIRGQMSLIRTNAYQVLLDGLQAGTPGSPIPTSGTGAGSVTFDPATLQMSWSISYFNLTSPVFAAHFHGPAVAFEVANITLPTDSVSPINGTATLTTVQAAEVVNGFWYHNIHTNNFGNGEIRGQVLPTDPARLANIATRMQVLTGNNVMIGGFVIGGPANKTVAIVATGPSLAAFGISNPLANPTLQLVRSSDQTVIATNDDWQSASNAGQIQALGFAPSNTLESAILINLPPGAYTAIVSGVGGGTGVGLVAVYEVDHLEVPLTNIATRGQVLTGNDVMIGGFVIQGSASKRVAIVATGPSLAAFGIANPLANPTLQLVRSSDQVVIAANDDWQSASNAAEIQSSGFAPTSTLESVILMTLPAGAYTAIVSGVGGGTGVGVVAVYTVP